MKDKAKKYTVRATTSYNTPIQPVTTNRKNDAMKSINWLKRRRNTYSNIRLTNNFTMKDFGF